ncbi:MarC family protein [Arcanobacterium canis]|uniref:UPF0056 membrane protein n=1 Tax=Arcanobacterium canis TaxID=999183 RepID=A0ABY8G1Z3_9ACTO|nr:MarC family protein [Arcanobacterium canis]WFM83876.1 MarC family protein [Arcanobacterium canis]
MLDTTVFFSAFATMLVITDPMGNLPIFMSLTSRMSEKDRRKTAITCNSIAAIILLIFGFFGVHLFAWMHISTQALQISGGLLLLIVALQLLTGKEDDPGREGGSLSVAAVPLGTPLLAGPGGIVAFMILIRDQQGNVWGQLAATAGLLTVLFGSFITMFFATPIMRVLGNAGIALLTKLSGMLLAAIAMQLIIAGTTEVFKGILAG